MANKSITFVKLQLLLCISLLISALLMTFSPAANAEVSGGLKDDGVYALLNKATGRYLDIQYDSPETEMYIQQYNYSSVPSSDATRSGLFKFTHRGSDLYLIRTMRNNGNTFYQTSNHRVKTTSIYPNDYDNPMTAHWKLEDAGSGYVYLRAYGSTEYLSVYDYDSNNIDTKYCVTQTKSAAGDHAKWLMIKYTGSGIFGAAFYSGSGNPSSVYMESSTQYRAYMWSTSMSNHGTIYWSVQNHSGASLPCSSTVSTSGVLQTYAVKEVVDVAVSTTGSTASYRTVDVKQPLETGLYNIKSNFSNCYLRVEGNYSGEYTNIIQFNYSSNPESEEQRAGIFKIIWTGTGNKYIVRTMTNNFNGIKQISTTAGSKIITRKITGSTSGIWRITRLNDTNYVIKVESDTSNLALASPKSSYDKDDRDIILAVQTSSAAKWNIQKINDITPFIGCHVGYHYPYILNNDSSILMRFDDLDLISFYSTDPSVNDPGSQVSIKVKSLTNQNSLVAYKSGWYLHPYINTAGMASIIAEYQNTVADPINIYIKPTTDDFFFLQNIQASNGFVKSFETYSQKTSFDYDDRQIWRRIDAGDGYYYIQNMDGNYLTAPTSSSTNQPILMSSTLLSGSDRDRQKWLFEPAPSGSGGVRIRSANITNRYLNIKSSNGKLIQDTYVNNSSYYDEFNVITMGEDVVFLRTLEGFDDVDPSLMIKNLSHHYDSFTLMHKLNHLGTITDSGDPQANYRVAIDLIRNSKIAIINGHGDWDRIVINDNEPKYRLLNSQIYVSPGNHCNLSMTDIVIFAGCSTAGIKPSGSTGENLPKSAELAGAKVAIGWTTTQYGNETNEWVDVFFEYMNKIDPSTGLLYTAETAFIETNKHFTSVVNQSSLYGYNTNFRFN